MSITEVIKKRKSCRTFNQEHLTPADKKALEDFIGKNSKSINNSTFEGDQEINLFILEKGDEEKKMKLDYGVIKGNNTYILGITKSTPAARLNYGYVMEKLVLRATEMGLATCWIGYFDHDYFNDLKIEEGYKIPGIVVIGYSAEKATLPERFLRFTANASQRLPWDKIFFDYQSKFPLTPQTIKDYSESLEMVRLAPSSSNTQPWRIYFDQPANEFHFFKKPKNRIYESMGMHELDLGIAMAHFELTSQNNGLPGSWICHTAGEIKDDSVTAENQAQVPFADDLQYMISWRP
ncbi:MAG: nitroreductase family protein [Rikenellaceae bacterium]